jgi:hypothetical protein
LQNILADSAESTPASVHGCTLACNTTAASAHNESSARGVP